MAVVSGRPDTERSTMPTRISSIEPPFAARPVVSIEIPDGWEPWPRHDAVIAAGRREWTGGFRPNMCVTTMRVEGGLSLAQAADVAWAEAERNLEFAAVGKEFTEGFGQDGFRFEYAFTMPDVGGLFQACTLTVVPHEAFTDVLYAVATCAGTQVETEVPVLRDLVASARLL